MKGTLGVRLAIRKRWTPNEHIWMYRSFLSPPLPSPRFQRKNIVQKNHDFGKIPKWKNTAIRYSHRRRGRRNGVAFFFFLWTFIKWIRLERTADSTSSSFTIARIYGLSKGDPPYENRSLSSISWKRRLSLVIFLIFFSITYRTYALVTQ